MEAVVLVNNLIKQGDENNFFYQCYKNSEVTDDCISTFNKCAKTIKTLEDLSYSFEMLTKYSQEMNLSRHDIRQLCDGICFILGEKMKEICSFDNTNIITSPTRYEDFGAFPNADLVLYSTQNQSEDRYISFDGVLYAIVDVRIEQTPYYTLYCHLLEKK